MTERGLFIVFEGGDGVGKTTQVRRLAAWLEGQGADVVSTREPGDTTIGRRIRELVLAPETGPVDSRAEALLMAADKSQHLAEVVRPALSRGAVVVCDRYVDSMIAYQGAGRSLGVREVRELADWATGGLPADLTVLLDAEPEAAVGLIEARDRLEGESDDFHHRVRRTFLELAAAEPARYLRLAARGTRDDIELEIRARVKELLGTRDLALAPTGGEGA